MVPSRHHRICISTHPRYLSQIGTRLCHRKTKDLLLMTGVLGMCIFAPWHSEAGNPSGRMPWSAKEWTTWSSYWVLTRYDNESTRQVVVLGLQAYHDSADGHALRSQQHPPLPTIPQGCLPHRNSGLWHWSAEQPWACTIANASHNQSVSPFSHNWAWGLTLIVSSGTHHRKDWTNHEIILPTRSVPIQPAQGQPHGSNQQQGPSKLRARGQQTWRSLNGTCLKWPREALLGGIARARPPRGLPRRPAAAARQTAALPAAPPSAAVSRWSHCPGPRMSAAAPPLEIPARRIIPGPYWPLATLYSSTLPDTSYWSEGCSSALLTVHCRLRV